MEKEMIPGEIINKESPILYRKIAKKLLEKYPYRKISREEAKRVLGLCFKIGKYKSQVFKELEDYGLLIWVTKRQYYINYVEPIDDEEQENKNGEEKEDGGRTEEGDSIG